jgi:hypothetical protein
MLFFATFALAALVVAWGVSALVSVLSGEKKQATTSLWAEILSRVFLVSELGLIGRALNYFGLTGWARKLVVFLGILCILLFFVSSCHKHENADSVYLSVTNFPTRSP